MRGPVDVGLSGGMLRLTTSKGDLVDATAPALLNGAPQGDYVVETRLNFPLPDAVEAGLVVYGDDRNFVRLTVGALGATRAALFVKATSDNANRGFPNINYALAGPAAPTSWLRLVKRTIEGEEQYTAYTSTDGRTWELGGTWTHRLGANARVGLVALWGAGYIANFDYLRVFRLSR